jgi:hypothetical protein
MNDIPMVSIYLMGIKIEDWQLNMNKNRVLLNTTKEVGDERQKYQHGAL